MVAANLLSLGLVSYCVGGVILAYFGFVHHLKPASSPADLFLLSGAALSMAGLMFFPSRPLSTVVRARLFMDSLMVMTTVVTFSWFFTLGPTILNSGSTPLGKALGAAYPLVDLLMIFCVVGVSAHGSEPRLRYARNLLCLAVTGIVVADFAFLYLTMHGQYTAGSPFDVGYYIAPLLSGQAILALRNDRGGPSDRREKSGIDAQRPSPLWRSLLPYALLPAVATLLHHVWKTNVTGGLANGVYIGGAILVALILIRQIFAITENSRLYRFLQEAYRELETVATIDGMTGLPNHRVFQQRLREEISHAKEGETTVCLLLIDVDRFKQYNDSFGHPAGDEALRIVARLLRENLRPEDLPARYGGEEFAAILPGLTPDEALLIAERLRRASETQDYPCRKVTLSIGVAFCSGGEPGAIIESADRALYAAKHGGRNRVELQSEALSPVDSALPARPIPEGWSYHIGSIPDCGESADHAIKASDPSDGEALEALLAMLNLRDEDVERHSERTMRYCLHLAKVAMEQGAYRVTPMEMDELRLGALLHDVGKVGVPDAILHKPGALDEAEWAVIQRHPVQGAELLARFPGLAGAVPIVRSHHERWDGKGYPDGLAGEAIPLGARIFALADTLDAMWSDRPYRSAMEYSAIRGEIESKSGSQFDPALVRTFLSIAQGEWEALRANEALSLPEAA